MPSDRRKEIFADHHGGHCYLVGDVDYDKDRKGYYFSARPEVRKDGFRTVRFGAGLLKIRRVLLLSAPRFNAARLAAVMPTPEQIADMKAAILALEPNESWGTDAMREAGILPAEAAATAAT